MALIAQANAIDEEKKNKAAQALRDYAYGSKEAPISDFDRDMSLITALVAIQSVKMEAIRRINVEKNKAAQALRDYAYGLDATKVRYSEG